MIDIRDPATENGLACDCTCTCCGDRLVARQGKINKGWSFAHEGGADCAGAIESALHKAAKQILEEEKILHVGRYYPMRIASSEFYSLLNETINKYRKDLQYIGSKIEIYRHFVNETLVDAFMIADSKCAISSYSLSDVISEVNAEGSLRRPDVSATTHNGKQLYVEFVVTNACDETKIAELKKLGVATIQINLSPLAQMEFTMDDVRNVIVNGYEPSNIKFSIDREWLVKPKYIQDADAITNELLNAAINKFKELKAEEEAQRQKANENRTEWTFKPKADIPSAAIISNIKTIYFMRTTIYIDQKDANASIWWDYSESVGLEISKIIQGLGAEKITHDRWIINGVNVLADIREAFTKKELEIRRQNNEVSYHLQNQDDRTSLNRKHTEPVNRSKNPIDIEMETKAIVAKHSHIVNYQWRRQKINEELLSLGYPLI
jgi:hypothetical protein